MWKEIRYVGKGLSTNGRGNRRAGSHGAQRPGPRTLRPSRVRPRHVTEFIPGSVCRSDRSLTARLARYVDPSVVILDLEGVSADTEPLDLIRGLLRVADTLAVRNSRFGFDRVVLARDGTHVFYIEGGDFFRIGFEYGFAHRIRPEPDASPSTAPRAGRNRERVMRTLPEKLRLPSGKRAYPDRRGERPGEIEMPMDDVVDLATRWAGSGNDTGPR